VGGKAEATQRSRGILLGIIFGPFGVLIEALLPNGSISPLVNNDNLSSADVEADDSIEVEEDDTASACLSCGRLIPATETQCRACGWSYKERQAQG
jgi:hypothetical protein